MSTADLKHEDLLAFDHAAAGHAGVLSDSSGSLVIKPCTAQEIAFYESAAAHPEFQELMPAFMGTLQPQGTDEDPGHNRDQLIVLENLTHGFVRPCVLDLKLGKRLWDEDASQAKKDRFDEVARNTTSGSLGMRIAGMSVWKEDKGEFVSYDKFYGRTFDEKTVIQGIREYMSSGISEERVKLVAKRIYEKITEIREVLEKEESRMYSASILCVYEGSPKALEDALKFEEEEAKKPKKSPAEEAEDEEEEEEGDDDDEVRHVITNVKLIDFAHARWVPGEGPDENALQGVRSAQNLFAEVAGVSA